MRKKKENLSKIAVKNSVYSFASVLILKIGGLIFTVIIARLLLPELFGIYALTLSVVTIALIFTDLGVNSAFIRYVSSAFGKNNKKKARAYFKYILKIKCLLIILVIAILLITSKYISYNIFEKPLIFIPLIFSCLYLLIESLRNFINSIFLAIKELKFFPIIEVILQTSKILFSLLAILLLSQEFKVSGIFVAFAASAFLSLSFSFIVLMKKDKTLFFGKKVQIEKHKLWKYIKYMGIASLSLVFFGSVDILMLGAFVGAEYIGYYRAALSLVLTISALLSISGVLLPIFTQIHKKRLARGFQKTFRYIVILTIPAFFGLIFISKYLIRAIYGLEYLTAASPLYALSLLVIIAPLIALYSTLFAAKEKAKDLAKLVFIALIINIFLNYFLIKSFLGISQEYAIIGAALATLISRCFLLGFLVIKTKSQFRIKLRKNYIIKPIIAAIIMSIFLILFNYYVNMNWFFGVIEIILGAGIYFGILFFIKGITKEDLELIKSLIKR